MKKAILGSLLLALVATVVSADVPKTINYQGRLTNLSGVPLADNINYNITVKFYLGADPGTYPTAIWTGIFSTTTKNGYFNIALTGGTPDLSTLDFNQPYYVGVKVEGDNEMTPRQQLNATPYALNISDAAITAKIASGAFPGYLLSDVRVFTASGTYTPSTDVRAILVECQGAGGGGGGAVQTGTDAGLGSGGGAGGYTRAWITPVAGSYSYVVGQGGVGGTSGNGSPGTANTSFDTMIAGYGAAGLGASSPISTVLGGGNGGSASGGNLVNISGGAGGMAFQMSGGLTVSGEGGQSFYGVGGKQVYNQPGSNGTGYGSGGSGASAAAGSLNRSGGNGANGLVIIWEYK